MMLPVFLVAGIVNLIANSVNYNINTSTRPDFDIRVRRDIMLQKIQGLTPETMESNIETPIEYNNNGKKNSIIAILNGNIDNANSRRKRENELLDSRKYESSGFNDRVNGQTYGLSSRNNLFTNLVRSLNLFSLAKSSTETNYFRNYYPQNHNGHYDNKGSRVFRQNNGFYNNGYQNPSSVNYNNNFYNPYNTTANNYPINGNTASLQYNTTYPYWNSYLRNSTTYSNNFYNNNGRNTTGNQFNGNINPFYFYNGTNNNGNINAYNNNLRNITGNQFNGNLNPFYFYNGTNNGNINAYNNNQRNITGNQFNGNFNPFYLYNGTNNNGDIQATYNRTRNVHNSMPNNGYSSQIYNGYNSAVPYNELVNNQIPNTPNTNATLPSYPQYPYTVLPINGNNTPSPNNGRRRTTTEKINIAEGCFLCATFSCPENQKQVGFKCVDVSDYDDDY